MRILLALSFIGVVLFAGPDRVNGGELPNQTEKLTPVVTAAPARGMESLSPGNRLIALALFNAQKATTITGHQAWSLDRFVTARAEGRNWGEVFAQLKRDGLVEAETLGQVVTWYQYHNVAPIRSEQEPKAAVAVKVVTQPGPAN